eukprot:1298384-Pyramimonas_sp.AAC.1
MSGFAAQPFKDFWADKVFPLIETDFKRFLKTIPKRVAERAAQAKRDKPDKSQEGQSKKISKKDIKERTPLQEKLARIIGGRAQECVFEPGVYGAHRQQFPGGEYH